MERRVKSLREIASIMIVGLFRRKGGQTDTRRQTGRKLRIEKWGRRGGNKPF